MASSDIYEHGFDESSGRTIAADTCPECGGSLNTDGGEIACRDCAIVIESCRLDRRGPRLFSEDDTSKARTGAPLTEARHDRGLSTEIGYRTDANGNTLPAKKQRQLNRLRREHSRARWRSKAERNLATGLSEVARITADLELADSLQQQASSLFRTAQENDLLVGRSVESIAAASVYATCRLNEATRTLNEVAAVAFFQRSMPNSHCLCHRSHQFRISRRSLPSSTSQQRWNNRPGNSQPVLTRMGSIVARIQQGSLRPVSRLQPHPWRTHPRNWQSPTLQTCQRRQSGAIVTDLPRSSLKTNDPQLASTAPVE